MYPPMFELASQDADVIASLGETPTKLYPFGEAPQGIDSIYAVWQVISGTPENYLSKVPDADHFKIQIDVYGRTVTESRTAARALQKVYEQHAYIMNTGREMRDTHSNLYRISFDVDFIVTR